MDNKRFVLVLTVLVLSVVTILGGIYLHNSKPKEPEQKPVLDVRIIQEEPTNKGRVRVWPFVDVEYDKD